MPPHPSHLTPPPPRHSPSPLFAAYASACFSSFGDRVKHWITFNEPVTFASCGYAYGLHAPGRCSDRRKAEEGDSGREPYLVAHWILNSHAAAVEVYRREYQVSQGGAIGITVDSDWSEPMRDSHEGDVAAAQRRMEFQVGWMLDPIFFGDYPPVMRRHVAERLPAFTADESALVKGSVDFVGVNHYTSRWVADGGPPADPEKSDIFQDQWLGVSGEDHRGMCSSPGESNTEADMCLCWIGGRS